MRFFFFLGLLFLGSVCFAQSKKDSLFSGKMKVDSALLAKSKVNVQKTATDSLKKSETVVANKTAGDTIMKSGVDNTEVKSGVEKTESVTGEPLAVVPANSETPALKYEDNNKVWKKFIDEYSAIINKEVLPSKKIKRGTYTIMLEYEIGTDGVVTTKNITSTPENKYLVEQVSERMMPNTPQLAPMIRDGVARKSSKRQVINFTKEKN